MNRLGSANRTPMALRRSIGTLTSGFLLVVLLAVLGGMTWPGEVNSEVRMRSLVVEDDLGNEIAWLGSENGSVVLRLSHPSGQSALTLTVHEQGGQIIGAAVNQDDQPMGGLEVVWTKYISQLALRSRASMSDEAVKATLSSGPFPRLFLRSAGDKIDVFPAED